MSEKNAEKNKQKGSRLQIFEIIITIFFNKEKAEKICETASLGKRIRVLTLTYLVLGIIVIFFASAFIPTFQSYVRYLVLGPKEIEFSGKEIGLNVLILPFHDANSTNKFKIEEVIEIGLNEEKENYDLNINVLVDSLSKHPKNSESAIIIGSSKNADMVIFGNLDSESREYRINYAITKSFSDFDIPIFIKRKHLSSFKSNLKYSQIQSLESLPDEKFVIYNILGFSALKENKCETGINLLNKAIAIASKTESTRIGNREVSYFGNYMAECYLNNQNFEAALPILDQSLSFSPDNTDARLSRVLVNSLNGDFEKTTVDFEYLKKLDIEEKSSVYITSGFVNVFRGEFNKFLEDIKFAKELDKKEGIPSIAEFILTTLQGDFDSSLKLLNDIEDFYSYPAEFTHLLSAYLHILDGNLEKARTEFRTATKGIPPSYNSSLYERFNKNYRGNLGFLNDEKMISGLNKALDSIDIAVKLKTSDPHENVLHSMILPYFVSNKYEARLIETKLSRAIKLNNDYSSHFNFAGLDKSQYEIVMDSIRSKKQQIKDGPFFPAVSNAILSTYYDKIGLGLNSIYYREVALSEGEEAKIVLSNKISDSLKIQGLNIYYYNKNNLKIDSLKAVSNKNLGNLFYSFQDYKGANKYFSEAFKLLPKDLEVLRYLSECEYRLGNPEKALSLNKLRIKLSKDDPLVFWNNTTIYYYQENYSAALKEIRKAINIFRNKDSLFKKDYYYKDYLNYENKIKKRVDSLNDGHKRIVKDPIS